MLDLLSILRKSYFGQLRGQALATLDRFHFQACIIRIRFVITLSGLSIN